MLVCFVARWGEVNKGLYPRLTKWYAPSRKPITLIGIIYLVRFPNPIALGSEAQLDKNSEHFFLESSSSSSLNAKGSRLIESVECERLMIGFLDMAASEIPLVDGVGETSQDAFQNIFQLKHLFLYGVYGPPDLYSGFK